MFLLNSMCIFFLLFLDDTERNAHKLRILAACLKLDISCHMDIDLELLPPPSTPLYPHEKVTDALRSLLGEGCFSKNTQLPHNYCIGMGLYVIFLYGILFIFIYFTQI